MFFADLSLIAFGFAPCWQFLLCYYVVKHKLSSQLPSPPLINFLQKKTNLTKLNSNKTKLLVVATKLLLWMDGESISPCSEVHNLDVTTNLTLSSVSQKKSKSAFYYLKPISRLKPFLLNSRAVTISSCLDLCSGILFGLMSKALVRLQYVQKSVARVLISTKSWQHQIPQYLWAPMVCSSFPKSDYRLTVAKPSVPQHP